MLLVPPNYRDDPAAQDMSLGAAIETLNAQGFACACCGPPRCCVNVFRQAKLLQRAAHIVARLMSDVE